MSISYPQYPNTSFPEQIDNWDRVQDITADDITLINQYDTYMQAGNVSTAQQILIDNPSLQTKIINATKINTVYDAIKALQTFFNDNVNGYIQTKQDEFQAEIDKFSDKGLYSSLTQYYKNNFVRYDDGSGLQVFLCIQNPPIDTLPTNNTYWQKLSIKGEKGDAGFGVGLSFRGAWDTNTIYSKDDGVQYGGSVFASLIDTNVGNLPDLTMDTDYWANALDVSITTGKLVGVRNLVSQTSNVNFIAGEISIFNPATDYLEVYQNSVRLTKDIDYDLNADGKSIDNVNGTWDGTPESPILFEFVVTRNQVNNLVFSDGSSIQDGTINKEKLVTEVQNTLNKVPTNSAKIENISTFQTATGTGIDIIISNIELVDGFTTTFIASADNSASATTINTKPLYKPNTTNAPNIISGKAYTVWYSLDNDCFFIKASAEGTATADMVLAGETFSNDNDTEIIGTMIDNGAITITPSTSSQLIPIPQGYHNGSGVVESADEWGGLKFVIENISGSIIITKVEFEGVQYELTEDSPFRIGGSI